MKFCKDCALYESLLIGPDSIWWERCNRPIIPVYDLVTGAEIQQPDRSPRTERYDAGPLKPDRCGAGGTYFIAKSAHDNS